MAREIPGGALAVAAAGAVLMLSGLRDVSVVESLQSLLRGEGVPGDRYATIAFPDGKTAGPTRTAGDAGNARRPASGTDLGRQAVNAARKYLGRPYVFGTHGPNTFDCSGLITFVLHHDLGLSLPNNVHTVTSEFYLWDGAETIRWDDQAPGDLVCWWTHIGMVVSPGRMIHAANPRVPVHEANIYRTPEPIIRRPKAYGPAEAAQGQVRYE